MRLSHSQAAQAVIAAGFQNAPGTIIAVSLRDGGTMLQSENYPAMAYSSNHPATAFDGTRRITSGALIDVIIEVQRYLTRLPDADVVVFDDLSGGRIDFDWSVPEFHLVAQLSPPNPTPVQRAPALHTPRKPGRPRLGVVAREVTLLPAHWAWLNVQPGGASATLRKLVEEAQHVQDARDRARRSQEAASGFMQSMAVGLPGYDEALRALYGGDSVQLDAATHGWPEDVRAYVRELAFPTVRTGP